MLSLVLSVMTKGKKKNKNAKQKTITLEHFNRTKGKCPANQSAYMFLIVGTKDKCI
jgi:hypothetical protein